MPPAFFTDAEAQHLGTFLEEWRKLKGCPETGEIPSVKTQRTKRKQLVERACDTFFQRFRERDPYQTDPGPTTLTEDKMKKFPEVS